MEETPDQHPQRFTAVHGRRARRHLGSGEIWQKDLLHGDHWEVYKNLRDFDRGRRDRAVWSDGRIRDVF